MPLTIVIYLTRPWAGFHRGGATVSRTYGKAMMDRHKEKVSVVLVLKNFHDTAFLARFVLWRLARIVRAVLRGEWWFVLAYWDAVKMLPAILRARATARRGLRRLSDREVLETIRKSRGFRMRQTAVRSG